MESRSALALPGGFQRRGRQAISLHRPLEEFLAQGKEAATSLGQGYQRLEQILGRAETEN
jgi:hypothetical protein